MLWIHVTIYKHILIPSNDLTLARNIDLFNMSSTLNRERLQCSICSYVNHILPSLIPLSFTLLLSHPSGPSTFAPSGPSYQPTSMPSAPTYQPTNMPTAPTYQPTQNPTHSIQPSSMPTWTPEIVTTYLSQVGPSVRPSVRRPNPFASFHRILSNISLVVLNLHTYCIASFRPYLYLTPPDMNENETSLCVRNILSVSLSLLPPFSPLLFPSLSSPSHLIALPFLFLRDYRTSTSQEFQPTSLSMTCSTGSSWTLRLSS